MVCKAHGIIINVNKFEKTRPELHILVKFQYLDVRWHQTIEVMAIIHFLRGAHLCLINEFNTNHHKPITKWLEYQRTKNLKVLEEDEDVKKTENNSYKR